MNKLGLIGRPTYEFIGEQPDLGAAGSSTHVTLKVRGSNVLTWPVLRCLRLSSR